jgi:transcriptional repressor NrdR
VKKDGRKQLFDKNKIEKGIQICCEKRIKNSKIQEIADRIEESLRKKGKKEIKSEIIGEMIMKKLKKEDNIAYLRFASIYRDFQDIKDFKKELKEL